MNKELILKYKNEFEYWLNGGDILMHYGKWVPVALDAKWEFFIIDLEIMGSFGYIIDDQYVEFRKALAEGKTIQCNMRGCVKFPNDNTPLEIWEDVDLKSYDFAQYSNEVKNFRIKPEFKVGDWVTEQGILRQIPEPINVESLNNHLALYERRCKRWKPIVGELVIMATEDYSTGFTVTTWEENSKFIPVPFTGELPK